MTDLDEPSSLPPSLRTAGDSWAITELVGATALGVAAGRAVETAGADPLIRDNFARILVSSAGQAWARLADPELSWLDDDQHGKRVHRLGIDYQAVRTHFFDEYFRAATIFCRRHSAGGDPRRRAGLAGLPAGLAGGHHGLRDRPAQGAGVQDRNPGSPWRGSRVQAAPGPGGSARRLAGRADGRRIRPHPTDRVARRGLAALPAERRPGPVVRDVHRAQRAGQSGCRRGVRHEFEQQHQALEADAGAARSGRQRRGADLPRARPFGRRRLADRPRLAGAQREQPRRDGPAGPPGTRRPDRRGRPQHAAAGASRHPTQQ